MEQELVTHTRAYREMLLKDAYRPGYHFALPDDNGYPGDPNGAFFADGVYHLMYLYKSSATGGYHWGHVSSLDLIHWRHHVDALTVQEGDEGCYSGGAFVDDDGTAYLSFWKFPAADRTKDRGGIALACAKPPYEVWERMEPLAVESSEDWGIADIEINGSVLHIGCADPSNIWKTNGKYYMQLGNKPVLDRYGTAEARYQGDWTELVCSSDLKKWEYVGRFYENPQRGVEDYPDETEDDMCPSFLPLFDAKENGNPTGKYLQLFISHNHGCQYYVGRLEGERFYPETHGRMSWADRTYFAPEALVDDGRRHIIWSWLCDKPKHDFQKYGWSGVYAFPRLVWWANGELKMAPADALDGLQYSHRVYSATNGDAVPVANGESFRLRGVWNARDRVGVRVRVSEDAAEFTEIYYSPEEGMLVMDTTHSGSGGVRVRECAPFKLQNGEALSLDVFVDKSVVEVYANERQAICRRIYPTDPEKSMGVTLIGERPVRLDSYAIFPCNPY
ncbi:MAG: glycoside hydrolase family 32 protein [Ruminococcaceae bacterium]|nr:glycoside hydrolase family 32 protein [Oscillospiraceae bacterium]